MGESKPIPATFQQSKQVTGSPGERQGDAEHGGHFHNRPQSLLSALERISSSFVLRFGVVLKYGLTKAWYLGSGVMGRSDPDDKPFEQAPCYQRSGLLSIVKRSFQPRVPHISVWKCSLSASSGMLKNLQDPGLELDCSHKFCSFQHCTEIRKHSQLGAQRGAGHSRSWALSTLAPRALGSQRKHQPTRKPLLSVRAS